MRAFSFFSILLISLCLGACQVKEKASDGGLVSAHAPTTNKFTLKTPTAGTYVTTDVLSITVTFPFDITVTGTPRLRLTVGSTTRYADYVSGDGSSSLLFQYTIVVADNDTNGVTVAALELNGGALTFDANGTVTNCDVSTLKSKTFSSVLVDNTAAAISSFALTNLPGFYHKDAQLNFRATFDEAVYVTGTPRIQIGFGTGAVYANYASGSGTTNLVFSYTVTNADADTNGYNVTSPIDLNGGTITDAGGNAATLTFNGTITAYSATVDLDGRLPYVTNVTPPANGTYLAAQNLDVTLTFDRAVTVTGSPYIELTIGSNTRQATYLSGSGTTALVFRYVTIPGDVDADGITIATSITQNAGNITGTAAPTNSYFNVAANNAYTVPSTVGVICNSLQPQPISVNRNVDTTSAIWGTAVDNVWNIDQILLITVGFNTNVYVDQSSGTPRIPITIGSTTKYATYLSGGDGQTSLVFRYVIEEGDLDTDGSIGIASIELNNGTITDISNTNALLTLPSASLTTTQIDGVRPTVDSVTGPPDGTYSATNGNDHDEFDFTVTWTEAVNYSSNAVYIPLTIGATAVNARYASGNNTTTMIHNATSLAGYTDTDGITVNSPLTATATIRDQAGNTATDFTFAPPLTPNVFVDTTAPSVSLVTSPAAGTYLAGSTIEFDVQFTEVVNVNPSGGYPRIAIALGSGTKYATYDTGSGTNTITFVYSVVSGDTDLDGIANPATIQITNAPTAYIRDLGWNGNATTSYAMTTDMTGVIVDAVAPTITNATVTGAGTYHAGDVIEFTITYDEAVEVTGSPRIQVAAQTGTLNFTHFSGDGTVTHVYRYTVTANDFDFDGLSNSITTIDVNGGTLKDAQGNDADLTFSALDLSGHFIAYPGTPVWARSGFTNLAHASFGVSLSTAGAATTETNNSRTYRIFNGDDEVTVQNAVNNVNTVYIVLKTPTSTGNFPLFNGDFQLDENFGVYRTDITFPGGTVTLNSGLTRTGTTNLTTNMSDDSYYILQVELDGTPNYSASDPLVPTTYSGSVAEIIMVNGAMDATKRSQIMTYLKSYYGL